MMSEHVVSRHDRGEDQGSLVYPVISRRSGGLSLGINLFPDSKHCSFDCPYCEVFPFANEAGFSPSGLAARLDEFFERDYWRDWAPLPIKDICISGNGEPTLSTDLPETLELCARMRRKHASVASDASLVLITNSTGFLRPSVARLLSDFCRRESLVVWAKLDAGSQEHFERMSRSAFSLEEISGALAGFSREAPVIIQTMLCALDGLAPDSREAGAYAKRINAMLERGALIAAIHFYTVARPPVDQKATALPAAALASFMQSVRSALSRPLSLIGYDERGEKPIELP